MWDVFMHNYGYSPHHSRGWLPPCKNKACCLRSNGFWDISCRRGIYFLGFIPVQSLVQVMSSNKINSLSTCFHRSMFLHHFPMADNVFTKNYFQIFSDLRQIATISHFDTKISQHFPVLKLRHGWQIATRFQSERGLCPGAPPWVPRWHPWEGLHGGTLQKSSSLEGFSMTASMGKLHGKPIMWVFFRSLGYARCLVGDRGSTPGIKGLWKIPLDVFGQTPCFPRNGERDSLYLNLFHWQTFLDVFDQVENDSSWGHPCHWCILFLVTDVRMQIAPSPDSHATIPSPWSPQKTRVWRPALRRGTAAARQNVRTSLQLFLKPWKWIGDSDRKCPPVGVDASSTWHSRS